MFQKISQGLLLILLSTHIGCHSQVATAQTSTRKSICSSKLSSAVDAIVNQPTFNRVTWGILVTSENAQQPLYTLNAEKYFVPASNTKLLTTAAALQALGADYRIRTSIYQDGEGIFRVVGRGDPSLKDTQLQNLAQQLRQKGIRQIKQLIADDSYFQGNAIHPSWMWEDMQYYYGTSVNSLIVNENAAIVRLFPQTVGKPLQIRWDNPTEAYRWRVENNTTTVEKGRSGFVEVTRDLKGPILKIDGQLAANARPDKTAIAVLDPIEHFTRHLRFNLAKSGISVARVFTASPSNNNSEVAAVESPPLSKLLVETNINSNNLFAEALLKTLGSQSQKKNQQDTTKLGLEVLQTTLNTLGVNPESYKVVDGSGLSRKNLISPEALVQTLQGMVQSPQFKVFRESLPVAGVSGTLRRRFKDTSAQGFVQAKTGTMTGVVTLSGYVNPPQYEKVTFSIMANQTGKIASVMRKAVDDIVVLLSQLKRC
ncbi:MAG: D-alanyl-D-alanine carboxypeptidase/D-alanyl-D-alanine-endopeptidase [Richelia sp.]|nr:D-alanyl-D-alanine carboxypeptidase/D-alanyl-D-alanine-endopeptidase [Richelia sp.]